MSRPRLMALLLALVTLLAYLPVARDGFVNYDDQDYVTENKIVQNGLTFAGIEWAFTTWHASNWHPLTWLSLMLDGELFGLNAGAYHCVNALFHAANVVLLFLLLWRLTNSLWPCAFIAALFAWHPLHVESVAWISERKDVLSTFFALLALLSYTRYAPGNCRRNFWFALIFFAFSLLAKPMFVTLPFVMLLLDFWPRQRFSNFKLQFSTAARLALEKWPFFLLTAILCIVTCLAQRGAVASLEKVSLALRLENSLVAYARYLLKIFWPADLAVFYPLPEKISAIAAAGAAAVLIFISAAAWLARKRTPYFPVGWLWFLGTLVPVIGLMQVGDQAMADRYTYFPAIGIFIIIAFGGRDLAKRFQFSKNILLVLSIFILGACLILTEKQLRYWRDSESLFRHALAVTKNNDTAHLNLGAALAEQGKLTNALAEFRAADQLAPWRYEIHNDLGNMLDDLGKPAEALPEYREAVRLNPKIPYLHNSLGLVLAKLGRNAEAAAEFAEAARLGPTYPWAHLELGKLLLKEGRDAEAVDQFREALRRDPDNFQILTYVAHVLAAEENPKIRDGKTALVLATKADALTEEEQPLVLDALGMAYAATGDFTNAQAVTQKAVDIATAAKMKELPELQKRLQLYKNDQPWRESFLSTNTPLKNFPKN